MKVPPEEHLRALLREEIANTTETAGTNHEEFATVSGSVTESSNVNMTVELVVKGKFTYDDIDELTGTFTQYGHVLSVLIDDVRFSDAAVVRLEAGVDMIVMAIQTLNLTKIGK